VAKYNQLLRIEEELGAKANSPGRRCAVGSTAHSPTPENIPEDYGLPALDGLTPTQAAAWPKEDRVAYVPMNDPTATPNKNAKQTAAPNLALLEWTAPVFKLWPRNPWSAFTVGG